jgi:tRNA (cytosine38-C5)-methyltransferase
MARLHGFDDEYQFPNSLSIKQCYKLLGNGLNVVVVKELMKYLFTSSNT